MRFRAIFTRVDITDSNVNTAMPEGRRKTRIAGFLMIVVGSVGAVLFLLDSLNESPAVTGFLQAAAAVALAVGGIRAFQGRNYRGTIATGGIFLAALVLGVAIDAVVRGGLTQPLVDAFFVSLFAIPILVALVLIRTGSAEFDS